MLREGICNFCKGYGNCVVLQNGRLEWRKCPGTVSLSNPQKPIVDNGFTRARNEASFEGRYAPESKARDPDAPGFDR